MEAQIRAALRSSEGVGVPARRYSESRHSHTWDVIERHPDVLKVVLSFGVLAPIYYVAVNELVAVMWYPGHDPISRPVSELTATYAATRSILVPLLVIFGLLIVPFWIGVWRAARATARYA